MTTRSLSDVAAQAGLSEAAVRVLHEALVRGRGEQAQFNHPELGGMGQWMRGGMIMIADASNAALKAKVSLACGLLAERAAAPRAVPQQRWWPATWGEPSMCASQDELDYALFPDPQRLAVRHAGAVALYDVSGADVRGVGAQSGAIVVQTAHGARPLGSFPRVTEGTSSTPSTDRSD